MESNVYQDKARSFAKLGGTSFAYAACGLVEEIGELFEKLDFKDDGSLEAASVKRVIASIVSISKAAGVAAKHIRKDWESLPETTRETLAMPGDNPKDGWSKELGDVCWFVANLCATTGTDLNSVMEANIAKLEDRLGRGVIIGSGDNR